MNESALYQAKIIEIKDNFKQLEEINIDTTNLKERLEIITKETEESIENAYYITNKPFLENTLSNIYHQAIKKLEEINRRIYDYNDFYKFYHSFEKLKDTPITNNSINEIIGQLVSLVNKILLSSNIIENMNDFLEEIYAYFYKMIKYEIALNDKSILLEQARNHPLHTSYIVKYIKEDIENISERKEEVIKKIHGIKEKGFDDIYYLDEDLISMLIEFNKKDFKNISKK